MRNLIYLISEAQRNFRNELFDSVVAQSGAYLGGGIGPWPPFGSPG